MYYTAAILLEKTTKLLEQEAIFLKTQPLSPIKHLATYHRHDHSDQNCMYLMDNTKGTRPLSACQRVTHLIYLASSSEFEDPETSLFYKKWMEEHPECISLMVLPPSLSLRQVEKALIRAFSFYNEWCESLQEIIRARSDWFALIEQAHQVLHNPMLIYDSSMKLLAYTKHDGTTDPIWTDTVSARTAQTQSSEDAVELLKYLEKTYHSDKPFRHVGKGMSVPFYSCNITSDGTRLGMVTETESNHPATLADQDLLWIFASQLTIPMRQETFHRQTSGLAIRQLIQDLIDGTIRSPSLLTTRLLASNWQPLPMIRILQFGPAIPYITEVGWNKALEALSALPLHGIGGLFSDQILYLCTTQTSELSKTMTDAIHHLCHTHHLRCGISDAFSDLLEVTHYAQQPRLALQLSDQALCFYDDVRFSNLTHHMQSYPHPQDLVHPAILQLRALDQETGSSYIETLQSLFDNQYRQVDAALSLGIHRTTLFYRLQKIEELTGLPLNDANEMLHLQLSLLILKK